MKRLLLLLALASACSDEPRPLTARDGATVRTDAVAGDATTAGDAAEPRDAAEAEDAAAPRDAAPREDAEPTDAGPRDAGPRDDAAVSADAEPTDAVPRDATAPTDAALDAGPLTPDATTAPPRGECTTAADCAGEPCLAVPDDPAGTRVCAAVLPPEATACGGAGFDACCSSADCNTGPGGACFAGPLFYCGGARPPEGNVCAYDDCTTDADCTATTRTFPLGTCVPRRAFGEHRSRCVYGDCRVDADCGARAGGECRPFFDPCNRRLIQLQCTYADSVCRADADCAATPQGYCAPGFGGMTRCDRFLPPP